MKLPWRSYCPTCDLHLKSLDWLKIESNIQGHYQTTCLRCKTMIEKYDTLDELDGFGRTVRKIQ